ncbi:vesicular glutamate transporter 3-like isoform X2 [Biomphalaria glabrata]|uniref:Vesicular glutamate transporter 3-like isoform X2 n=1 Tax=Biomphalaria glabrata TaxID=6526 RepID=A0A9W2YSQ1_BIOGL|nr:vesicular glutamate transporter 3-like isoform X2 [Biomphalaria glabrata]
MAVDCCTCMPHRYFIVMMCSIGMLISVGYRTSFSLVVTHIDLVDNTSSSISKDSDSFFPSCSTKNTTRDKVVNWKGSTTLLFGTFYFIGQILFSLPGGILVQRYSAKWIFVSTIFISSILQLLLPLVMEFDHIWLIHLYRFVQGSVEAITVPALNGVVSPWTPAYQRSQLMTLAYAGVYFSPAVASITTGACLCYVSWSSIMYIYGGAGVVWSVFYAFFAFQSPEKHPGLCEAERAIFLSHSSSTPSKTLIGLLSGIPHVFMVVLMLIGGNVFDYLVNKNLLSRTNSRKLAETLGFGVMGACILAIGFLNDYVVVAVLFCVGVAFSAFSISGYQLNPLDLAPKFVGPLTGISRTGTAGSIVSTLLAAKTVGETHKLLDWHNLFIVGGSLHLAGVLFYCIFASGNIQPWAQPESETLIGAPSDTQRINASTEGSGIETPKAKTAKTTSNYGAFQDSIY